VPAAPAADFRVRHLAAADVAAAMRLKEEAGWNQGVEDWRRFLAESPRGCFAAEKGGQVIGTCTTIVYDNVVAWIGMVLVDPRFRGGGIGKALLGAALAHLEALGVPTIKLDATPQGRPLYAKLGFIDEYEIERWTLRRPPEGPADGGMHGTAGSHPARAAARAEVQAALDDIVRLDREAFGADRRALVTSVAASAPELVVQARRGGEMEGFAMGRHGSHADQLGPLVARDAATAQQLLDEFLTRTARAELYVDMISAHPWVRSVLLARDFQPSRPLMRMYKGAKTSPGEPGCRCAILGPEYG
jgi:GNAT superfamily N-acetyltransferase